MTDWEHTSDFLLPSTITCAEWN